MIKPIEIRYIKKNNILSLTFEDGLKENLTIEYLRCFSPSAEVRGHGPGQEKLQKVLDFCSKWCYHIHIN